MKILVLGGNRFFGKSVLLKLLQNKKNHIFLINRTKSKFKEKNITQINVDRKQINRIKAEFKKITFDVVFDNIAYQLKDVKNLEKIFKGKIKHYIFTSSVMTYLNLNQNCEVTEKDWFKKKSIRNMKNIYFSKEINYAKNKEKIEKYLINKSKLNYTILRIHNVIGNDDFSSKTKKLFSFNLENLGKNILSQPNYIQFCFKEDLIKIIIKIINKKKHTKNSFNVGNHKINLNNFFAKLKKKNFKKDRIIKDKKIFPLPINILLDSAKIEKYLNFKFTSINKVIEKIKF